MTYRLGHAPTFTREHGAKRTGAANASDNSMLDFGPRAPQIAGLWRQALAGWRFDDTFEECAGEGEV
jgi:hypothetical protein